MKLADALLRRKELKERVDRISQIKNQDLFELKYTRKQISDTIDDIQSQVPKCTLSQVTQEYDYYANKLRLIDGAIQQLNWTTDIIVEPLVWKDYLEAHPVKDTQA